MLTPSSSLNQVTHKFRTVSDRLAAVGYTGNEEDFRTVSELMDEIREAATEYQVSHGTKSFRAGTPAEVKP